MEPTRIGPVLPEGSNFEFAVPIAGVGGRGLAASIAFYYNSRVWTRRGSTVTFDPIRNGPSAGFSLGFGKIVVYGSSNALKYLLIDPDGTRHYLGQGGQSWQSVTLQTNDGSHITYAGDATLGGTLYYNDGMTVTMTGAINGLVPTRITDRNGNYIDIGYGSWGVSTVTDTLGRVFQFTYDMEGYLKKVELPGFGGTAQEPVSVFVHFDYQDRQLSYNFSGLTVENASQGQSIKVLRHVYFTEINTGYLFSYSDYGMIHTVSLRKQMSVDGNGVIIALCDCV